MNNRIPPFREDPPAVPEMAPQAPSLTSPDLATTDTRAQVNEVVNTAPPITAKEALELLRLGAKKKVPVTIAGELIKDPGTVRNNFLQAYRLARQKMKGYASVELENISFKPLSGIEAGESIGGTVFLNPKQVLYQTPEIAAMVIGHEFGHQFGDIENEGMIQALIEVLFENSSMPHTYQDKVAKFNRFAEIFDQRWFRQGDYKRGVKSIYKLYLAENFAEIKETSIPNYVRTARKEKKLKKAEANSEAESFFQEVFPEIQENSETEGAEGNVADIQQRVRQRAKQTGKAGKPDDLDMAA